MEILLGFSIALAVIALVFFLVSGNRKNSLEKKMNEASARLLKEEYLSSVLDGSQKSFSEQNMKLLIRLSWNEHGKQEFVVDPAKGIVFGRDKNNQVIVDYEKVSAEHCRIILNNGRLFLQDMNSLNGTFLIRGRKTYRVQNMTALADGDVIQIGGRKFTINPFYFDMRSI